MLFCYLVAILYNFINNLFKIQYLTLKCQVLPLALSLDKHPKYLNVKSNTWDLVTLVVCLYWCLGLYITYSCLSCHCLNLWSFRYRHYLCSSLFRPQSLVVSLFQTQSQLQFIFVLFKTSNKMLDFLSL